MSAGEPNALLPASASSTLLLNRSSSRGNSASTAAARDTGEIAVRSGVISQCQAAIPPAATTPTKSAHRAIDGRD